MGNVEKRLAALAGIFEAEPGPDGGPILDDALMSRLTDEELDWLGEPVEALPRRGPEHFGNTFDGHPKLEAEFDRRVRVLDARRAEIMTRLPWKAPVHKYEPPTS